MYITLILGGLLIAIKKEYGKDFLNDIKELDGWDAYIIGDVINGKKSANIIDNPNIIECTI